MKGLVCIFMAACLALHPQYGFAQQGYSKEVIEKALDMDSRCYPSNSNSTPHPSIIPIGGSTVEATTAEHFEKARFSIANNDFTPEEKEELPDLDQIMNWYNGTHNSFNILAHGAVYEGEATARKITIGGKRFTAKQVAKAIIKQMRGYQLILMVKNEPLTIVLHSCCTGHGENCFAQQLADCLSKEMENVRVVAPDGLLYFSCDEKTRKIISEKVVATDDMIKTVEYIGSGKSSSVEGRNWKIFEKGKAPVDGETDCNRTIDRINAAYFERLEEEYRNGKRVIIPSSMR